MKCPYCHSPVLLNDLAGNPWYKCGTTKTFRSGSCVDREPLATELRNALARIKRLEDAGDAMAIYAELGGIPLQFVGVINAWREAKEAKP